MTLLVWTGRVTPFILLAFTFLAGSAAAVISPAWQAIVPQLVPRQDLPAAVALNSAGFNASRAVGPALAGLIIAGMGLAAPFCLNAISYLGVIAALFWWHAPGSSTRHLPAERFGAAIRTGLRHARHNPHLRATLIRASGSFLFASAYWALLPLVARNQVGGGPELYGILLGVIGAGAVGGAMALPWLTSFLGADKLVAGGTIGTAVALVLFGLARQPAAERTPPIRRMLDMGIPVGAGTDATRVPSYNPWVSLYWLATGRTVGGVRLYPEANRLDRMEALRLYTIGSSWFSGEDGEKGMLSPGRLADLAVLSADYLTIPEEEIRRIESVLTIVGGKVVYGAEEFGGLAPPRLPVSPDWSPVRAYGGYHRGEAASAAIHKRRASDPHRQAWLPRESRFWGIGCDCFAF